KSLVMVLSENDEPIEKELIPLATDRVYLKIACDFKERADKATFFYSLDAQDWKPIGDTLQMRYTLPHFMGYRFGLFSYATRETGGYADFDYYRVSDGN
ncbi:MAG TPA: glycoside hydrolase, partial [Marinilabiliaceae bacterium]|nr:glycoside hydrolase [Marinilabiliaceae bacterium]